MGIKEISGRISRILGQKKKERRRKADKLAELLDKLEKKHDKMLKRVKATDGAKERQRLEGRIRAMRQHLRKGREELARLRADD